VTVNFQNRLILDVCVFKVAQKLLNTRRLPRLIFFHVTFAPFCVAVKEGMVDKIGFHRGPVALRFCIERNGFRRVFFSDYTGHQPVSYNHTSFVHHRSYMAFAPDSHTVVNTSLAL
jgi:hypothetical protein